MKNEENAEGVVVAIKAATIDRIIFNNKIIESYSDRVKSNAENIILSFE